MTNSRIFALAAVTALALTSASARAQQTPVTPTQPTPTSTSTTTSQPTVIVPPSITVNKAPDAIVKRPKVKLDKYKGRVLAFNIATIMVQSLENPRMVWSFQYSIEMRERVANMLSAGGYQPGDIVTVYCNSGTTVAVKFKGKPSKPI